jgi:nucleotide-binding universal stress UspA family protein
VVYAFHPIPRSWGEPLAENAIQAETTQGKLLVDAAVDRLKAEGVRAEGEVIEGMAADVITRLARMRQSEVIVIGSRGLSQTTAFLLGSVSIKVAHKAHCPVLIIK